MKYLRAVILFTLILPAVRFNVYGQLIYWKPDRPIRWEDFQNRKRPVAKRFGAAIYSGIQHKLIASTKDTFAVRVYSYCNPYLSWKKHGQLNLYLLRHEQTHFDITELYARRVRSAWDRYTAKHTFDAKSDDMFYSILELERKKCRRSQKKYDRQTRHSKRRQEQARWNEKIAWELKSLKAYADTSK